MASGRAPGRSCVSGPRGWVGGCADGERAFARSGSAWLRSAGAFAARRCSRPRPRRCRAVRAGPFRRLAGSAARPSDPRRPSAEFECPRRPRGPGPGGARARSRAVSSRAASQEQIDARGDRSIRLKPEVASGPGRPARAATRLSRPRRARRARRSPFRCFRSLIPGNRVGAFVSRVFCNGSEGRKAALAHLPIFST